MESEIEYKTSSLSDNDIKKAQIEYLSRKEDNNLTAKIKALESKIREQERGRLGRIFGGGLYASKNITALICLILLVVAVVFSFVVYFGDCNKDNLIEYFWDSITPIITLSLGYLFGRK